VNVVSFDKYAYAGNNPIKFKDPSGHAPEWFDWVQGAAYQYANNLSMGQVEQISNSLGVCMDCNVSDAYREGQQAGQIASIAVASVDQVVGALVVGAGAAAFASTLGEGGALALASGGILAPGVGAVLVVEGVIVVAGVAEIGIGTNVKNYAKNNQPEKSGGNTRKTKLNPSESKIWKNFDNYKGKTKMSGTGKNQRFYQWDYTHGDIEVYDSNGDHLGSMDPTTGEMYKPPEKGYTLEK
jgi:hypothetical protein